MEELRKIIREEVYRVISEMGTEDPMQLAQDMINADEETVKELEAELKYRQADARVSNLPKDERDARTAMVKVVKDRLDMAKAGLDMAKQSEINAVKYTQMQTNSQTQQQGQSQIDSQI